MSKKQKEHTLDRRQRQRVDQLDNIFRSYGEGKMAEVKKNFNLDVYFGKYNAKHILIIARIQAMYKGKMERRKLNSEFKPRMEVQFVDLLEQVAEDEEQGKETLLN